MVPVYSSHGLLSYDVTSLHGVTMQRTLTWIFIATKTSNLTMVPGSELPLECE